MILESTAILNEVDTRWLLNERCHSNWIINDCFTDMRIENCWVLEHDEHVPVEENIYVIGHLEHGTRVVAGLEDIDDGIHNCNGITFKEEV